MKIIMISLILVFSSAVAAEEKGDYKCFVETTEGETLMFFRWKIADAKRQEQALVGQTFQGKKLKSNYVKKVMECQLDYKSFANANAQRLDKTMVR
ncbi:hypothetical protein FLM48_05840 [Shewanella sp. Scap07]|uniref:TapY2 family type IVa secretion system protein n=1 Tax=Shewanella sp. Scap07 TaxID=2589987 RepID=UPI0015B85F6B|nr:TapY2 family type IVa secretion system protein [Shewanella sp. Scap07]QLE84654.1 hypothetical protein FLM48_05840 [Shewanella sp. Scap07]